MFQFAIQRIKKILFLSIKNSLIAIADYIEIKGYPDTALKFIGRMEKFSKTLTDFPDKYPICRNLKFAKRNYHCAVFENNYMFLYKTDGKRLIIYNVIHCS